MTCQRAFTLMELMIVMVIVAILAMSAVPLYSEILDRSYEAEILFTLSTLRTAQRAYRATCGAYPGDMDDLVGGDAGMLAPADFQDMKYVEWNDFSIDGMGNSIWRDMDGNMAGRYSHTMVRLSKTGGISRG